MTKKEYERLQNALDKEAGADMFRKYGKFGKWVDGFRAGIKAAKWIVYLEYTASIGKNVQTVREGDQR